MRWKFGAAATETLIFLGHLVLSGNYIENKAGAITDLSGLVPTFILIHTVFNRMEMLLH